VDDEQIFYQLGGFSANIWTNNVWEFSTLDFNSDPLSMALSQMIRMNTTLTGLSFVYDNFIWTDEVGKVFRFRNDETLISIASGISQNSTLKELSLSKFNSGREGVRTFVKALERNSGLTTLHFDENYLKDDDAFTFADLLKANSTLTYLSLSDHDFSESGFKALGEAMQRKNSIQDFIIPKWPSPTPSFYSKESWGFWEDVLTKNTSLRSLDLKFIHGANTSFLNALYNVKFQYLFFYLSFIFFQNKWLTSIKLTNATLQIDDFLAFLSQNTTLRHIELSFDNLESTKNIVNLWPVLLIQTSVRSLNLLPPIFGANTSIPTSGILVS